MHPANHAWIAGAVLGPIFVILVLAIILVLWRRNRAKRTGNGPLGGWKDKAQLHGDSLVVPRHELDGEKPAKEIAELPAREPVGEEVPG